MSTEDRRERLADVPAALLAAVDRRARRATVAGRPPAGEDRPVRPDGIDFVELVPMARHLEATGRVRLPRYRTLLVHLVHGPVPGDWDASRVAILGGVREDPALNPVGVRWAHPALEIAGPDDGPGPSLPPQVTAADRDLVRAVVPPARRGRVLAVRTTTWGDLSGYVLRILPPGGDPGLPPGLDPPLAQDRFTFAIDCPDDLDCRAPGAVPHTPGPQPVLDYLARDYPALRRRLLDRMTALVPGLADSAAADVGVMLLELMAHLGDLYAYRQDAAALEAYLTTARRRTSVRRHARLLGYPMGEGCSARTWLALDVDGEVVLPAGTAVSDVGTVPTPPGTRRTPVEAADAGATVFETTRPVTLLPGRNRIALHHWGDPEHVLPAGSTAAFLAVPAGRAPRLAAGDVVVLAELPAGGIPDPRRGDPGHRQAVRLARDPVPVADDYADLYEDGYAVLEPGGTDGPPEPGPVTVLEIRWGAEDALDAPVVVSERGPTGRPVVRAVALANVVLADQGATVSGEELPQVPEGTEAPVGGAPAGGPGGLPAGRPAGIVDGAPYRPRLARPGIAVVDTVDPAAGPSAGARSARAALRPDAARARAAIALDDGLRTWTVRRDLLDSSGLDPHVVPEADDDGVAWLRFGDGDHGRRPPGGSVPRADYRLGAGAAGNVAAGTVTELLRGPDGTVTAGPEVIGAWNPVAAHGGLDPEAVAAVQQLAPQWFREQARAVTTDDHRVVAEQVPGVQRAVARRRWTGSWHAVEVLVDPEQSRAGDASLPGAVLDLLERRRMAATDVEVRRPLWVPVLVRLSGCVLPGHDAGRAAARVRELLSARILADGTRGLFHPDNLTFGQPLYLSDLVATAMTVPGLAWIEVTDLRRLGGSAAEDAENRRSGRLAVGPREVIRCESDPSLPEFGRVDVQIGGGP